MRGLRSFHVEEFIKGNSLFFPSLLLLCFFKTSQKNFQTIILLFFERKATILLLTISDIAKPVSLQTASSKYPSTIPVSLLKR